MSDLPSWAQPSAVVLGSRPGLHARRVIGVGDSITANGGGVVADSRNHIAQAVLASGGRLVYGSPQQATFGYTTAQMLAAFFPSILTSGAGIVPVLGGVNDISGAVSLAAITANLKSMYSQLLVNGQIPVACSIPPNNGFTSAQRKQARQLNLWIAMEAYRLNIPFADYFTALVDPTTGNYKAGCTSDGTHPNGNGGVLMGPVLANAIANYFPAGSPVVSPLPLIAYGDAAGGAASGNMSDNPLALRSTVSPPMPDAFGVGAAGAPANVYSTPAAAAPGLGNTVHAVTGNGSAAVEILRAFMNGQTTPAPGDVILFGFRVGWTPAAHAQLAVYLLNITDSVTRFGGFTAWDTTIAAGSVWWQECVVPAACTSIEPRVNFGNDGTAPAPSTFDWGQLTVHNITQQLPAF